MIVKMIFNKNYEEMIECDTIHRSTGEKKLELSFYKSGKLVESPVFKDSVQIFIMENGKTIERIDFGFKNDEGSSG